MRFVAMCFVGLSGLYAQGNGLNVRELYYQAVPSIAGNRANTTISGNTASANLSPAADRNIPRDRGAAIPVSDDESARAVPSRLGVRYNLFKVDIDTAESASVDPDT